MNFSCFSANPGIQDLSPGLDGLPFEIIEIILNSSVISHVDICKLSQASQLFNCIGKSNKLWRLKFAQKWPSQEEMYERKNTDWKNEFRLRYIYQKSLIRKLNDMAVEFYHEDNISQDSLSDFRDICENHPITDEILIYELENIILDDANCKEVKNPSDANIVEGNLTQKHYAKKALRFIRHKVMEPVWQGEFHDGSGMNKLTLLKGACLLSEWCQPTEPRFITDVYKKINKIVEEVYYKLQQSHPKHPSLARKIPKIMQDSGFILDESEFKPSLCKQVLSCINDVMFNTMEFDVVSDDSFISTNHIYIDKVLKYHKGVPITVAIIYHSIAAQFGVCCLPVNFPGHFLLKWRNSTNLSDPDGFVFIDMIEKGAFKTENDLECLIPEDMLYSREMTDQVTPLKVFTRMCWNLVEIGRQQEGVNEGLLCLCDALELLYILTPGDMEHKLLLARVYMHLCINMTRVVDLLQQITDHDPVSTGIVGYMYRSAITTLETQKVRRQMYKLKVHPRDETAANVQFAVGMLMRHKKYDYRCVIYGWDNLCSASKDWKKQMGVHKLPNKDEQPFYHVLVEDGTNRYAAQENLEISDVFKPISHSEVGRYFEAFHGNFYLPNSIKREEYPGDVAVRKSLLS